MSKYNELVTKLREIFQIDRPELDFGIYCILNARAGEINRYLEERLPEKVKQALSAGNAAQQAQVAQELKDKEAQYKADGIDPANVPKVQELRQKLAQYTSGANEHENAVFSHLLAFFSRYFDNGDFISQRRYKGDTYAIPYAGEEVMLHWANKDQYYTKSGENFANYSFKLEDGRKVHFRLVAADTAKDNRKDNDKERRFVLLTAKAVTRVDNNDDEYEEELLPVEVIPEVLSDVEKDKDGKAKVIKPAELIIRFEYASQPKGTKQDVLSANTVQTVLAHAAVKARWLGLGQRAPTEKNPQRTLLEKHLSDYTTKNTADYFIHKDLGGFLKRELDFYIKNEVMHLDDVQNAGAFADIEKNLRMIQCLRSIALELITFLAQLEDFQKKLWLKKKFVVSSHYCITLDRVPEALWPDVVANAQQWARWKQLGVWDGDAPGTMADLKAAPYRMVDTGLYNAEFKYRFLSGIEDLDQQLDGLLIQSDNFHALSLLEKKFRSSVKAFYVDPPYNTGKDGFLYKDNYLHATWLAFMQNRLQKMRALLKDDGALFCSIDDSEAAQLEVLLSCAQTGLSISSQFFVQVRYVNKTLSEDSDYHKVIERVLVMSSDTGRFAPIKETTEYGIDKFEWKITELSAGSVFEAGGKKVEVFTPEKFTIEKVSPSYLGLKETWATGSLARQKGSSGEFFELNLGPRKNIDGLGCLYKVHGIGEDGLGYRYFSGPRKADATKGKFYSGIPLATLDALKRGSATKPLPIANFMDFSADFGNCRNEGGVDINGGKKPEAFVSKFISLASGDDRDLIVDPFSGSGTTPAVALKTGKKFIGIEVSEYIYEKIIPRIQRVYFGDKNLSESISRSGFFEYNRLEGYEDTLNNLHLRRPSGTGDLFNGMPKEAQDDYLLRYMLDVESRGSLLSVDDFKKPFDYQLNVAVDSAGAFEPRQIDLVETFNYLIGLRVKHIDAQPRRGFVTVTGTLPSGESCLVLWRDCDKLDYEGLNKLCDKLAINPADNEYDVVYLNGDHNIPTVLTQTAAEGGATRVLKLRQIEPEFLERMFSVEDV